MVTAITNKLLPEIEAWQKRPLSAVYPIVYIDAIVFNTRENNVIRKAAAYPLAEYQRCIVHEVRNTLKYVADKDKKAFANDLKAIYHAPDEQAALACLDEVRTTWERAGCRRQSVNRRQP